MFALTHASTPRAPSQDTLSTRGPDRAAPIAQRPLEQTAPAPERLVLPDAPSTARTALRALRAEDAATTIHNATSLLERAADPASGDVAKRKTMLRAALKQLATTTPEQLAESAPKDATPLERAIHTNGLGLARAIGKSEVKPTEKELGVLSELFAHNPHSPVEVLGVLAAHAKPDATLAKLALMYPAQTKESAKAARAALSTDLGAGGVEASTIAALRERKVPEKDIEAFMNVFADVRRGFELGAKSGDDMQRTNWIHTRIEVLHTLETAKRMDLTPDETLMAALGSLTSDAFKDASVHSLLTHNRAGAELVLPLVMGRAFELSSDRMQTILAGAMRVAHEHQITPAMFMAGAMKSFLAGAPEKVIDEVFQRTNDPLVAPKKDGEIVFSPEAQAVLAEKGVLGWAVPSGDHRLASLAAIAGDVQQYISPDGILKIAVDIRDPEQKAPFMRDGLLRDAVQSSMGFSFEQGMKAVNDRAATETLFKEREKMETRISGHKGVYERMATELKKALGVAEKDHLPLVPYFNEKVPTDRPLTPEERASVDLVKRTFQRVLAEEAQVPLDPFGTKAAA